LAIRASRLRRLRLQRMIQGCTLVLGVTLLVGVVHFAIQKHVTLVVGGRPQAIQTTSSSVRDLLAGEGIALVGDVSVVPPPTTQLADGMTVVVSPAPGSSGISPGLATDPASTDVGVWVVAGTGATASVESSVSAASAGTSPVVSVRAVVSGKVHDVSTNAGTAGALLSAMGITPDADDRVQPPPSTPLHDGDVVTFEQVQVLTRLEVVQIPFGTITSFSEKMVPGTRRVVRRGVPGEGRASYRVTMVDGHVVSRELIGRWVERHPRPQRVVSGPESMYSGTTEVPGTSGHTQSGVATWYDPPWSGLTAAHPTLPFGTMVTVTDLDSGRSVTVVIDDRGPFAEGRIIDLSPEAFEVLAPLGRGVLRVRITW
jgi:rare lipoprotein A